jgi:hypothetical protein
MNSERMKRTMRMAALAVAATLVMSGLALARDDDDYYRQGNPAQARQYGYDRGYKDGAGRGKHEGRERDPNDYQTPDWRQATRGYKGWMGPMEVYQRGYQEGYREGFRSGFESVARPWGNGERGAYGWRGGYNDGRDVAYRFGYQDGAEVARGDLEQGKPYNPNPRSMYGDRDHGYRSEFGNKDAYRAEYSDAYRRGYDEVMNRRY